MASAKKILLRVVSALAAVCIAALLAGTWWASTLYRTDRMDTAHASAAFAEVRRRFPDVDPAFEIEDTRLVVVRDAATGSSSTEAAATHILVWNLRDQALSRVTLPLWISKVATEPLPLEALAGVGQHGLGALMEARRRGDELNIRIDDLKRYGRTLLLDDVTADGKRVMIWSE